MDGNQETGITEIISQLEKASYEDKKLAYQSLYSIGYILSESLNDRLVLISLVSLVCQKMKLKDPNTTPLEVLMKISGQKKDDSGFYQFLETLAIIVSDFSYGVKKIDTCGCKTSQEIINKIKELLNLWLPF